MSIMEAPLTTGAGDQLPTAAASPVSAVPPGHQLGRNPQLPQHPLGAYTDAQYEAAVAALRSNVAKQYADVLQKLGYQDENGNFIMGSVETDANRQKGLLHRSMGLADEDVMHTHQQNGTLFSGLRGTDQARAEFPFNDQIGQIETQTPLTLSQLYEQGSGLMSDYTLQDNQLIADAAARAAGRIQAQPAPSVAAPPPVDGGGTISAGPLGPTAPETISAGPLPPGMIGAGPITLPSNPGITAPPPTSFGAGTITDTHGAVPGGLMPFNSTAAPSVNSGVLSATQKKLLNMPVY